MAGIINIYSDQSFGIGHDGMNCPCNPTVIRDYKASASGRGGRHQGYKVSITLKHNELPAK